LVFQISNYAGENMAGSKNFRPNFVFITSDQHGSKYLGLMGHPIVKTPNLDKIADGGVVFLNSYCGNPVCVPSRSSMMTGMYASDVNSFCNSTVYDGSYPTWAKQLRDEGYYCWATGKQDLNPEIDMGFVEEDVDHEHFTKPDITSLFRRPCTYRVDERGIVNGKSIKTRNPDKSNAELAIDFIKNKTKTLNQPWICYVGFHMPHPRFVGLESYYDYYLPKVEVAETEIDELENLPLPYQKLRDFKRISTPIPEDRIRRAKAAYFAMISEMDEYIGEIYQALQDSGQIENTYFIYTSDHGESLGEHGLWFKNNLYDVAAKIPLIISGPNLVSSRKINHPVGHIDLAATILEIGGINNDSRLRGKSLLPLIKGETEKEPEFVYSESFSEGNITGSCMIRKGNWKLIYFSYYDSLLFNLENDPDEKNNLINDPQYKVKADELKKLLLSIANPDSITDRAFDLQDKMLAQFVGKNNQHELMQILKGRLGDGQAIILSKQLKNESYS